MKACVQYCPLNSLKSKLSFSARQSAPNSHLDRTLIDFRTSLDHPFLEGSSSPLRETILDFIPLVSKVSTERSLSVETGAAENCAYCECHAETAPTSEKEIYCLKSTATPYC